MSAGCEQIGEMRIWVLRVQVGRSVELVSCLDYFGGGERGWVLRSSSVLGLGDECKDKDTAYLAITQCLGADALRSSFTTMCTI